MSAAGVTHRRAPWLWPAVLVAIVLVAGVAVVGVRTLVRSEPDIWPVDGTAAAVTVNGSAGGTLEQAVLTPAAVQRLGRLGDLATATTPGAERWLRAGVTPAAAPTNLLVTVTERRARLAGFELADAGLVLAPGLELATPGSAADASQSGRAQTLLADQPFQATVRSSQRDDCATTEADLAAPQPLGALRLAITLCAGRGVTDVVVTSDTAELTAHPDPAGGAPGTVRTRAGQVALTDPTAWRPRNRNAYQDGGFGPQLPPAGGLTEPAPLGAGRLAGIDPLSGDIVGLARPAAATLVRLDWRGHPGGRVTDLVGAGDLVVAVTDTGRAVGYGPNGVRVWSRELAGRPVAVGLDGGRFVCALHDGSLIRLDPSTGEEVQRSSLGVGLDRPGVVAAGRLIALAGDELGAWDLGSGDPGTGQRSWARPAPGLLDLAADELTVATASPEATTALATVDGRLRWDAPSASLVVAASGRVISTAGDLASVLGPQGVIADWRLDAEVTGVAASAGGLVLTTADGLTWLG